MISESKNIYQRINCCQRCDKMWLQILCKDSLWDPNTILTSLVIVRKPETKSSHQLKDKFSFRNPNLLSSANQTQQWNNTIQVEMKTHVLCPLNAVYFINFVDIESPVVFVRLRILTIPTNWLLNQIAKFHFVWYSYRITHWPILLTCDYKYNIVCKSKWDHIPSLPFYFIICSYNKRNN